MRKEATLVPATVRFWLTSKVPNWRIVLTTLDTEDATLSVVKRLTGNYIMTRGRSKAEMLNEAIAEHCDARYQYVYIFDSDSRPVGALHAHRVAQLSSCPSIYRVISHGTMNRLAPGMALHQTIWSFGFERAMFRRRKLWYLVGHGYGLAATLAACTTHPTGAIAEDLALGYQLARRSDVVPSLSSAFRDEAQWPDQYTIYAMQLQRWFIGDLQAAAAQLRGSPLAAALRITELVSTWLLGPPLVVWSLVRLVREDRMEGGIAALAVAAAVTAPALVSPPIALDPEAAGDWVMRLRHMLGLLARPVLDSFFSALVLIRWVAGEHVDPADRSVTPKLSV